MNTGNLSPETIVGLRRYIIGKNWKKCLRRQNILGDKMSPETFYLRQDNMPFTYNMSPETYNNVSKKSFFMSPKMFKNLSGHTDKKPSYIFLKKILIWVKHSLK